MTRPNTIEDIESRVELQGECRLWTGSKDRDGYALVSYQNKTRRAHKLLYEIRVGKVPEGLILDHTCRNRSCINTDHLEPVTNTENCARGQGKQSYALRTNHCVQGHEYTPENTYTKPKTGLRMCKTCARINQRKRRQREDS